MKSYTHLTLVQREFVASGVRKRRSQSDIANWLGVHKSTISRELQRNRSARAAARGYYIPRIAEQRAQARHQDKVKPRITPQQWAQVERCVRYDISPEQTSAYLKQHAGIGVSHEWIYRYIRRDAAAGGDLHTHLRHRKRRRRHGQPKPCHALNNRTFIDQRPQVVDDKSRIGDLEADTIYGKRPSTSALLTIIDRKSRYLWAAKVASRDSHAIKDAMVKLLAPVRDAVHTITADNGSEFGQHRAIAEAPDADFYFAHPYSPWQRGASENANGLLRQYYPKGKCFADTTARELAAAVARINNRPRKCLNTKTPNQVRFNINPPLLVAVGC